ncbi:hypothetical protein OESDEN_24318, partial [Oesophagostomum dentatum]
SFNLGPYDRTRFDLVEQFHPLPTASVATGEHLQELRRRVSGVKSIQTATALEHKPAHQSLHDGSATISTETPDMIRECS